MRFDFNHYLPRYPDVSSSNFNYDIFRKREFHELTEEESSNVRPQSGHYAHQDIIARFISNWTLYENLLLLHDTGTGKSVSAIATYDHLAKLRPRTRLLYVVNNDNTLENFRQQLMIHSPILRSRFAEFIGEKKREDDRALRNRFFKECGFEFMTYFRLSTLLQKSMIVMLKTWKGQLIIMDEVHHLITQDMTKKTASDVANYDTIKKFVKSLPYKKILYMTATPMRNSPEEIAPLMNLMLKDPIPQGAAFVDTFLSIDEMEGNIPLYKWKSDDAEQLFIETIRGLVSVVKQRVDVRKIYRGEVYFPMKYFRLVIHKMSAFQSEWYEKAFLKDYQKSSDKIDSTFYNNSVQASLFVFPNGVYGIQNSGTYFTGRKRLSPVFFREFGISTKAMDTAQIHERLNRIRQFSVVYASILKEILFNPDKLIYVYCDKINGSGIWLCVLLLNAFFGYQIVTSYSQIRNDKRETRRCIFLNDVTEDAKRQKDVIDLIENVFNNENNSMGQYAQVIFGTDKTREGITLKRIQQIHIVSPDWNFGKIFQAIGRGVRLQSHLGMTDPEVSIYFHCVVVDGDRDSAIPETSNLFRLKVDADGTLEEEKIADTRSPSGSTEEDPSSPHDDRSSSDSDLKDLLDELGQLQQEEPEKTSNITEHQLGTSIQFYKYYRSELRDRNVKLIEYTLLIGAMDCALNYNHNLLPLSERDKLDNTWECYYRSCMYSCVGVPSTVNIDDSTYNLYYIQEQMQNIIDAIRILFERTSTIHIEDVFRQCSPFTPLQIMDALRIIIRKPVPIHRFDGRHLFLSYHDAYIYVINTPVLISWKSSPHDNLISMEQSSPSIVLHDSLKTIHKKISQESVYVRPLLNAIRFCLITEWPRYEERGASLFQNSPVVVQIVFLQTCLYTGDAPTNCEKIIPWIRNDLYRVNDRYVLVRNNEYFWFTEGDYGIMSEKDTDMKRVYDKESSGEIDRVDHEDASFLDRFVVQNRFHVYGFFAPPKSRDAEGAIGKGKDILKIRDVRQIDVILKKDKKNQTKGQVCTTFRTHRLLTFLALLEQTLEWWNDDEPPQVWRKVEALKRKPEKLDEELLKELRKDVGSAIRIDPLWFRVFSRLRKTELCSLILKALEFHNLLVPPPLEE